MLQTFLQQFIPAMEEGLMLGVPLGILFVLIRRLPHDDYKKSFRSALKWGFWLSIFLVAVRVGTRNAVSRELLEGFATFITLLAEAVILSKLLSANENFNLVQWRRIPICLASRKKKFGIARLTSARSPIRLKKLSRIHQRDRSGKSPNLKRGMKLSARLPFYTSD